jgi:hypothetical protein
MTDGLQHAVGVNPMKYNRRVKVRAARVWQISGTSKGKEFSSMEIILINEEVHQLNVYFVFEINLSSLPLLYILFYRA